MKTLIIDTSSASASAAIFESNQLLGEVTVHTALTHSQKLMPVVDAVLKQTELSINEIDAYAVCEGPGSFTGVRIGLAAVKGFALPSDKPIYTYSSMMLLASGVKAYPHHIIAVIDAKRSDVYYGIYHWEDEKLITIEENVDGFEALIERLNDVKGYEAAILIGDATQNYPEIADQWRGVLADQSLSIPRSGNLNLASILEKNADNAFTAKANYMRKSQAERDR